MNTYLNKATKEIQKRVIFTREQEKRFKAAKESKSDLRLKS